MPFEIEFTQTAADHVRAFKKFDQQIIFEAIDGQLANDATTETRNRKRVGENELSDWELRVQKFRVFYDIVVEDHRQVVKIKAVGHKEHNSLYIGGKEVQL
jgi:mRNA-degrading endonuclease RelE of RelBE toxin-antitoxin system